MLLFLAVQNSYEAIDIALFSNNTMIAHHHQENVRASKDLVPLIDALLHTNNKRLSDLAFIAVNQGPGPFTTLRVTIATANGISFASSVPLIGVDGLRAFLNEHYTAQAPVTVALLNAFGNDVYVGIQHADGTIIRANYTNILILLQELKEQYPATKLRFIGAGSQLYADALATTFGDLAELPATDLPTYCSIEQIGRTAYDAWQQKERGTHQLMPLYLKEQMFKLSM